MDAKQAIVTSLNSAQFIVDGYTGDLTPAELMSRPVPGCNHIAWQWGHLLAADRYFLEQIAPGKAAALPAGFEEKHKKDKSKSDNPADFCSKEEYQRLTKDMRASALKIAESLSPADLDKPMTGVPPFLKTVGETLLFLGPHWIMHAGQWAVIRRKCGHPPLF